MIGNVLPVFEQRLVNIKRELAIKTIQLETLKRTRADTSRLVNLEDSLEELTESIEVLESRILYIKDQERLQL